MKKSGTIVFCDFDGTITHKDSLIAFIKYYHGKCSFYNNSKIKELIISYFFKGISVLEFKQKAGYFSLNIIDKLIIKKGKDKLNWHQQNGHKIVIVSASLENYLKPWCLKNNFDLLATKLEISEKKLTGKIKGINCYGNEKVSRIKKAYNLNEYDVIYGYGDTKGDLPMLNLSNYSFYKEF